MNSEFDFLPDPIADKPQASKPKKADNKPEKHRPVRSRDKSTYINTSLWLSRKNIAQLRLSLAKYEIETGANPNQSELVDEMIEAFIKYVDGNETSFYEMMAKLETEYRPLNI
jgi:ABC-type Zn2+ transport system substrate-binding protein/surface adhesin